MKRSSICKFRSIAGKILMGLVFLGNARKHGSGAGSRRWWPYRRGRHDNRRYEHRERGHDNWRYEHRERGYDYYQPYGYRERFMPRSMHRLRRRESASFSQFTAKKRLLRGVCPASTLGWSERLSQVIPFVVCERRVPARKHQDITTLRIPAPGAAEIVASIRRRLYRGCKDRAFKGKKEEWLICQEAAVFTVLFLHCCFAQSAKAFSEILNDALAILKEMLH